MSLYVMCVSFFFFFFFFLMIRRPPRSTLFPYRRSSDLVAVLAAYGVNHTDAFAYGIILQAVEVATAFTLGMPSLVGEGMSWKDLRLRALHASPVELSASSRHSRDSA